MKKVLSKIGTTLEVVIIVLLFVISLASIAGSKNDGVASVFGVSMLPVQSDSMVGANEDSFSKGDLLICKSIKSFEKKHDLEVGNIITYKRSSFGAIDIISHRIIRIEENGDIYVLGDNPEFDKTDGKGEYVPHDNIKCVYVNHINNAGKVVDFFKDQTNYALFIVLPLVLLFAWNLYSFIKLLVQYKRGKQIETAVAGGEVSEELKEIALREYLAKMAAEQNLATPKQAEKPVETNQVETEEEKKD